MAAAKRAVDEGLDLPLARGLEHHQAGRLGVPILNCFIQHRYPLGRLANSLMIAGKSLVCRQRTLIPLLPMRDRAVRRETCTGTCANMPCKTAINGDAGHPLPADPET